MTDAVQHRCTRAWYMRPPVWIFGIVLVALAVFGIIEMIGRPAAIPYSDFLDQLTPAMSPALPSRVRRSMDVSNIR